MKRMSSPVLLLPFTGLLLFAFSLFLPASAAEEEKKVPPAAEKKNVSGAELAPEEFLAVSRRMPGRRSWALLEGEVVHRREGARTIKAPLRLGLLFTQEQTIAQLDFNNGEIYNIGQVLGSTPKTVLNTKLGEGKKALLPLYGLEPQDLTMSFLYWDFLREEKGESVRKQSCRKFILKEKGENGRFLRVLISSEYFFPVSAEFFSSDPEKKLSPYKTLEITSFVRKENFWYPGKLRLEGDNWKSMVSFGRLEAGEDMKTLPKDLFH